MLTILKPWVSNDLPSVFSKLLNEDSLSNEMRRNMPAVNIAENDEAFKMEVAAPGMKKENFNINIEQNLLTIEATHEEKKEEENEKYNRREFNYSSFKRTFSLPETIDQDNIKASYEDGVLKIALPKKDEAKTKAPRKIDIG